MNSKQPHPRKPFSRLGAVLSALLLIGLAMAIISPRPILLQEKLEMDAASYISHAFTLGLDRDLDYSNEPIDTSGYGYFNETTQLPSHPMGPGVMAAPFVAAFSILDQWSGHPVIDNHHDYLYSWSKFGYMFAGLFWFFLALILYADVANRLSTGIRPIHVLLIGLGCGVVYYTYHDPFLGHQFEFFTIALVIWSSVRAWLSYSSPMWQATLPYLLLAALGMALTHFIRPANVNVVILPVITFLALFLFDADNQRDAQQLRQLLLLQILTAIPVLVVLGLIYNALYGTPFPLPGDMYGSNRAVLEQALTNTEATGSQAVGTYLATLIGRIVYVPAILFSSEFGLLYTSSVMVLGVFGLMALTLLSPKSQTLYRLALLLCLFLYIGIPGAVVLHWQTTASAYGWRYLFSLLGTGFLGCFLVYKYFAHRHWRIAGKVFMSSLLLLSTIGIAGQVFWGSTERLHFHSGENIFGVTHGAKNCCSGKGYLTRLATDITEPSTLMNMAASRYPGYLGSAAMQQMDMDIGQLGNKLGIPEDRLKSGLARYSNIPPAANWQLGLLLLVTVLLFWNFYFARADKKKPENVNAAFSMSPTASAGHQ